MLVILGNIQRICAMCVHTRGDYSANMLNCVCVVRCGSRKLMAKSVLEEIHARALRFIRRQRAERVLSWIKVILHKRVNAHTYPNSQHQK